MTTRRKCAAETIALGGGIDADVGHRLLRREGGKAFRQNHIQILRNPGCLAKVVECKRLFELNAIVFELEVESRLDDHESSFEGIRDRQDVEYAALSAPAPAAAPAPAQPAAMGGMQGMQGMSGMQGMAAAAPAAAAGASSGSTAGATTGCAMRRSTCSAGRQSWSAS